ncbi:hypothetical protein ES705_04070 [subsurface metagenome]
MIRFGEFLYKYRAVIAVLFFIILILFSKPRHLLMLPGIFIIIGLMLRIWAAGYIGKASRENKYTTRYAVVNGPYHYLKHPLYLGNFFLVSGVILLFSPPSWLGVLIIILFIFVYLIIIYSELNYLKGLSKKEMKFKWINTRGEISTIVVMIVIFLIYFVARWGLSQNR